MFITCIYPQMISPRLDQLHNELDQAVCAAYGWEYCDTE